MDAVDEWHRRAWGRHRIIAAAAVIDFDYAYAYAQHRNCLWRL